MISLLRSQYKPSGNLWTLSCHIQLNSAATTKKYGRLQIPTRTGAAQAFGNFTETRYLKIIGIEVEPVGSSLGTYALPTTQNIRFNFYRTTGSGIAIGNTNDISDAGGGGAIGSVKIITPSMLLNKQFSSSQETGTLLSGEWIGLTAEPDAAITNPCAVRVLVLVEEMRSTT